jgi:hypothetical protein
MSTESPVATCELDFKDACNHVIFSNSCRLSEFPSVIDQVVFPHPNKSL